MLAHLSSGRLPETWGNSVRNVTVWRTGSVPFVGFFFSVALISRRGSWWIFLMESESRRVSLVWGGIFLFELRSIWHRGDTRLCVYVCVLYKGQHQSQEFKHTTSGCAVTFILLPLCSASGRSLLEQRNLIPDGFVISVYIRGVSNAS